MKKLIALVCAAAMFAINLTTMAFSDTSGHWAENDINEMTAAGYLDGYPDGTFLPDKSVSRAEFLKIITLRYGITQNVNGHMLWGDVRADDWYSGYSAAGLLIPEYTDGNLYPSEPLQRYEAALALLMIYGIDYEDNTSNSAMYMGDYDEYASDAGLTALISAAIDSGIMNGKDNGFEPYDHLTRAEFCTLLNRLKNDNADVTAINFYIDMSIDSILAADTPSMGGDDSDNTSQGVSELAYRVLELVNVQREENGLEPLQWDDKLANAAQAHCEDMIERNFFDHNNPDGESSYDRIKAQGVPYFMTAENIAAGQQTPESVMDSWMNSEGHRANILNPELTHIGIGVAYGGYYGIYWTQCFGG